MFEASGFRIGVFHSFGQDEDELFRSLSVVFVCLCLSLFPFSWCLLAMFGWFGFWRGEKQKAHDVTLSKRRPAHGPPLVIIKRANFLHTRKKPKDRQIQHFDRTQSQHRPFPFVSPIYCRVYLHNVSRRACRFLRVSDPRGRECRHHCEIRNPSRWDRYTWNITTTSTVTFDWYMKPVI